MHTLMIRRGFLSGVDACFRQERKLGGLIHLYVIDIGT